MSTPLFQPLNYTHLFVVSGFFLFICSHLLVLSSIFLLGTIITIFSMKPRQMQLFIDTIGQLFLLNWNITDRVFGKIGTICALKFLQMQAFIKDIEQFFLSVSKVHSNFSRYNRLLKISENFFLVIRSLITPWAY